jgi:hypothetical protein
MGVDIYLGSVWDPFIEEYDKRPVSKTGDAATAVNRLYDDFRASGGYFRNAYNCSDCMWVMGLSWFETVRPMLDKNGCLPVERARELLDLVEERPLTREYLTKHYRDHLLGGADKHPVQQALAPIFGTNQITSLCWRTAPSSFAGSRRAIAAP